MIEEMLEDIYKSDFHEYSNSEYFNPIGAHESGEIGEDPNGIPNNLVPYIAKVASGVLDKIHVFGNMIHQMVLVLEIISMLLI